MPKQSGTLKVTRDLLCNRGREMCVFPGQISEVLLVKDMRLIQPLVRDFEVWEKRDVGLEEMTLKPGVELWASRIFEWQDRNGLI
jgi:hypothetical protein